jgi:phosphatidylserine synthase
MVVAALAVMVLLLRSMQEEAAMTTAAMTTMMTIIVRTLLMVVIIHVVSLASTRINVKQHLVASGSRLEGGWVCAINNLKRVDGYTHLIE